MPAGIDKQRAGQSPVSPTPAEDSVPERSKETDDSVPEHSKPEDLEMQKPRMPTRPVCPSVTEKEEHEASGHAVYRSWCEHCIAAKGQANPHRSDGEVCEAPELGFDYGYMGRDEVKRQPIICCRDRKTASHAASYVPRKGKDPYALSFLVSWVKGLGYKRVVCRSDNEPALLALLSLMSASMPDIEFVPKTSPEGDHQANGLAEIGVREAKGQVRVLRSQLEANLGERLSEEEPYLDVVAETCHQLHQPISNWQ